MCLTVMVTGNHYLLDIAGGFLVAGTAWLVARSLPDRLPGLGWLDRSQPIAPPPAPAPAAPRLGRPLAESTSQAGRPAGSVHTGTGRQTNQPTPGSAR
jgi:hypothetical protein